MTFEERLEAAALLAFGDEAFVRQIIEAFCAGGTLCVIDLSDEDREWMSEEEMGKNDDLFISAKALVLLQPKGDT